MFISPSLEDGGIIAILRNPGNSHRRERNELGIAHRGDA
jgi:hypothetical protein